MVPSPKAYDHLNLGDLTLDSHTHPTLVRLKIKQSKTDPFRQAVEVFLGHTYTPLCPLIQYLRVHSPTPGPLFVLSTGSPLQDPPLKESSSGKPTHTTQASRLG